MTEGRQKTSSSDQPSFVGRGGANARLNVTVTFQDRGGFKAPEKPQETTSKGADAAGRKGAAKSGNPFAAKKPAQQAAQKEAPQVDPAETVQEAAQAAAPDTAQPEAAAENSQSKPKAFVVADLPVEEAMKQTRKAPALTLRQMLLGGGVGLAVPVALLASIAMNDDGPKTESPPEEPVVAQTFKQPKQRYEVVETASGRVLEVIEADGLQAYLRTRQQEADRLAALLRPVVLGCDSPEKFNEFWVPGLDRSQALQDFIGVYKERMGVGQPVGAGSGRTRIHNLQVALSVSDCFASTERRNNTGVYDAEMKAAVKRFQQANGLPATGEADQATVDKIVTSAAMRITYVMHSLDLAAKEFDMDTADILQVAWHESFYSNMLDSGTGPEGVGQMTDDTFLNELENMEHPFHDEYRTGYRAGGEERRRVRDKLEEYKHSVELGSRAMVSHCATLVDEWNKNSCAAAYPIYQLGAGDYLALRRAARSKPNVQARRVAGGTRYNNYGNMTAARAFTHVSSMVDNSADRRQALGDLAYLQTIQKERAAIARQGVPGMMPGVTLRPVTIAAAM